MGETNGYIQWTVNVPNDIPNAGVHPIMFRYALAAKEDDGNRPLELTVNDDVVDASYDFIFTDNWKYWEYSKLINVTLVPGDNLIKLTAQNGGPNIDHMIIGKPDAVIIKLNGYPRAVAKVRKGI